ncbi:MAG TPA: hypothetical protein VHY80_11375 [Stellaceae bacterium]|jgi:hypothetical protein|nr:hypothetical protein [Stellaceae bacterium]
MSARIEFYLAAALLIAPLGSADAAALQPNASATPNDPAAASNAPNSSAPAYNQAATDDPYNQSDFGSSQSFGLAATQMLGAAAACEQLHADSISLGGMQAAKNAKPTDGNRSDLDAAQQNMLDPVATSPGGLKAGAADCDRVSGAFGKLQEIQLHNPNLTHELDEPDATYPSDNQPQQSR